MQIIIVKVVEILEVKSFNKKGKGLAPGAFFL
jgi:hypothetical protein